MNAPILRKERRALWSSIPKKDRPKWEKYNESQEWKNGGVYN